MTLCPSLSGLAALSGLFLAPAQQACLGTCLHCSLDSLPPSCLGPWRHTVPAETFLTTGTALPTGTRPAKKLFLGEDFTSDELLLSEEFTRATLPLYASFSSAAPMETTTMPTAVASVMVMMMKQVR